MAIQKKSLISNLKSSKVKSTKPVDGATRLSNSALSNVALSKTTILSKKLALTKQIAFSKAATLSKKTTLSKKIV